MKYHIKDLYGIEVSTGARTAITDQLIPDLKNDNNVHIACIDGLTGLPEAIANIFPQTEISCVSFLKFVIQ